MEKSIAFFDFDGTITRKDTMIEFIKYWKGSNAFYKSIMVLSPWLMGMKLGIISNSRAKERMLAYFFKGMQLGAFNELCKRFAEERLPALIRSDAMEAIQKHQLQGDEVVVVSASAENWIKDWCDSIGIKYIGTRLAVDNKNRITGQLDGPNCNGQEKVNRIILSYDPADYKTIYSYGDSKGDASMLQLASHRYYRHFKK